LEGWLLTHYIKDLGEPEGQPADAEAGAKFKFDLFRGM